MIPIVRLIIALLLLPVYSVVGQERFVTLNETEIWTNTIGLENRKEGQPVVIFESGLGTPMDNWDVLLEEVANFAPLVTYDRPGIGASQADGQRPTIDVVATRLVALLDHLRIEPPYLLVGHSLGGLYVRGFANYFPELLAGLVIIDPADFTEDLINKRMYYEVLGWNDAKIDAKLAEIQQKLAVRRQDANPSIQLESEVLATLRAEEFEEIKAMELPDIPVHIITGGRFDMPQWMRSKEYDEELLFRSKMKHRIARWIDVVQSVDKGKFLYSADAGHFVHIDDPQLVISSVEIVLKDYKLLTEKSE